MSGTSHRGDANDVSDSDDGEIFLDEDDVIQEILIDEEELPDQDDEEMDSDVDYEEADDSLYMFKGHTDELYTVACNPVDASLVATGGKDDRGFLWKIGSQDSRLELQGHSNTLSTVAFSFDGKFLASGGFDGKIQVWEVNSGSLKCKLEGSGAGAEWLKWHPRGHLILAGLEDSSVWLWNADKNVCLKTFYGHASSVTCGDFTPDGKLFCTGSDDASLRIWNPKTGESIHIVRGHPYHTDGLTCLSISHDSTRAITGSKDSSVHVINLATGRAISSLSSHSESVESIGLSSSPSFPWAATGSLDQKMIIWDLQRSSPRCICDHEDGVTCLLWLGQTRYVATGCVDGKVRIWDSLSGGCVRTFSGHVDVVQSLAITADENFLVSASNDCTARVFSISEFK
ncbi:Dynein assembly factor with WDR repeat domains 1 [Apostasia shenzhenica]|uniref:Dynein assembly factor with WDR repeat domains 1 n=1 Tax=Apostasia shenzhenica TaxID=1088818 RepID=A0A2I0AQF6_9ASPA|nr:Dynein assembly factor with WDR repeat domains 1 [Apostasia shenzhenica]